MKRTLSVICLLACVAIALPMLAQQKSAAADPLTGTWTGDWGPATTQRNQVTFVMNWDGKNISGIINPGPDVIPA